MTNLDQGQRAPSGAGGQTSAPPSHKASALTLTPVAVSAGRTQHEIRQTQSLRVLVVSPRFLPDLGGVETHVFEITRRIAKIASLDLTVLTTDRSGTLPAREDFHGFSVVRCRSYPRRRDYYLAPRLHGLILRGNYDLVHCQGIHTAVPILAMLAARRAGIPYMVTFHTGGHSSGLRHRLRNTQWRALGPLLRGATALIAVSHFEQQLFEKACRLDASRFRVIRNGGDLPTIVGGAKRIQSRIVSSGRLERYKGHHRVIEALPIVQRSIPDATLHILGSGPYEGNLRKLIMKLGLETSVTIEHIAPGDRARMAQALGEAAVFATMSEYEAHPVAVMEALTMGVPVVGLDTAGMGDLVEEGLVRGVPKDSSPVAIARTLIAALSGDPCEGSAPLATWDSAASDLAHIYRATAEDSPYCLRSHDS
jgi:glycosyltransferase involved in cell wall biosynthesis